MPQRRPINRRGKKPSKSTTTLRMVDHPKIGDGSYKIYLHHTSRRYYLCRWNPRTRKLEFQSLRTMNLKEAVDLARAAYQAATDQQERLAPFLFRHTEPTETLQQAFEMAFAKKLADRRLLPEQEAITKRHWGYFARWIADNCPSVKTWAHVTDMHIEGYVGYLKKRTPSRGPRIGKDGIKTASILRYLLPVNMVSKYMHKMRPELYRLHNVKFDKPPKQREPKKFLTPEQAVALYIWAKDSAGRKHQYAAVAIALGCFSGLRLKEIAMLTLADVDVSAKTLTVHVSKSDAGMRVIPLTKIALSAWTGYVNNLRIVPVGNAPLYESHFTNLCYRVKHLLVKAAKALDVPDYARCSPREALRKTFANLMEECEIHDKFQRALFGHSANESVLHNNYREDPAILPGDMDHVKERKLEKLRSRAIVYLDEKIDTIIEKQQFPSCNLQSALGTPSPAL
jgi:integrase